jgi:hypothetical protein
LPLVSSDAAVLPQGLCGNNERCVPCYNPAGADPSAPTGACSIPSCGGQACDRPHDNPVILSCPWTGPAVISPTNPGLPDCNPVCNGAHCLPAQFVPPSQQGLLSACGSGDTAGYCTPDNIIEAGGEVKPTSCTAFAGVPASEGRCLSPCLKAVSSQPSLEACPDGVNTCAPCYNPITGVETGACSSSKCDSPQLSPPYVFPNCCAYNGGWQGRCVPKSQVPPADLSHLQQDECSDSNYMCVPNELLPGGPGPSPCSAGLLGAGSCYSACISIPVSFILPNCIDGNHKCIPCAFAPKGSPGC